jgi:hypothetical protein
MQQQSTTLVITSTSNHKNADVERPLLNSGIDRFGSGVDGPNGQVRKFGAEIAPP